jgi:tetratricopeptide (TPR) repeat protein
LVSLVLASGCASGVDLINEGDRLSAAKRYDEALERYHDALLRDDLSANDREHGIRARGQAQFDKGDVTGAEATWKTLPKSLSARSALLGHCAYTKRDTASAETLYREAFSRGERGVVTAHLAEIVGGEARTPDRLSEAARFLKDGAGDAALAQALDDARAVWDATERGEAPIGLLAKLERARPLAPRYISIETLRADLLERAGDHEKSRAALVALASFEPRPSAAYLEFVSKHVTEQALRSGNTEALHTVLGSNLLTAEQAAGVRSDIARGLEAQGDLAGALALYNETASAGGTPLARALCEVGRLEAASGHADAARAAWQRAVETGAEDNPTRARVALARALMGDPLGARPALEAAASDGSLEPDLRETARGAFRASTRLKAAIEGLAASGGHTQTLARSALDAWPGSGVAIALAALPATESTPEIAAALESALAGSVASGETRDALADARIARLLDAGLFDELGKAIEKDPGPSLASLVRRAPRAIGALLEAGRVEDAASLFERLKARKVLELVGELTGRVRADARFAALWSSRRFVQAVGSPDPLARSTPYACELTLAGGTALGVVRVVATDEGGLLVMVPGREAALRVSKDRLFAASAYGVEDDAFERADRAARELRVATKEGE